MEIYQRAVYPRVYGGTWAARPAPSRGHGLSPRVRGNHFVPDRDYYEKGSIPACTGEPWVIKSVTPLVTVYPRVYGGTLALSV